MPNNFERFTERARRVMSLAVTEAMNMGQSAIGPEHLFIALIVEHGGVAARVLLDFGITVDSIRPVVAKLSAISKPHIGTPLTLSTEAQQSLAFSMDVAREMGHHYIGTEHLLLGLVRATDGIVNAILTEFNLRSEDVVRKTRGILSTPVSGAVTVHEEVITIMGHRIAHHDALFAVPPASPEATLFWVKHYLGVAEGLAKGLRHRYLGTEHLLLALLTDNSSPSFEILTAAGISLQSALDLITVAPNDRLVTRDARELRPELTDILERATKNAMGSKVLPEHLLLAIVLSRECRAANILEKLNASPSKIKEAVLQALN